VLVLFAGVRDDAELEVVHDAAFPTFCGAEEWRSVSVLPPWHCAAGVLEQR